ncbi:IS66 family transposase [Candidatus Woesearchaeota archaeon]|nr:IS66 family transposase [Candidatus Woesearchaeota archaeon]
MKIPQHLDGLSKRDLVRYILVLEEKIPLLEKKIEELERRLLAYENAHTPPSQQRHYPKREKKEGAKVGAPLGHEGFTRETPEPTEIKKLESKACPHCNRLLGKPHHIERRVIEEIPEPQPLRVIEFFIPHYHCKHCNKDIVATDPELPSEGNLGNNLQSQIVLKRYEDRLPMRKVVGSIKRDFNVGLTPATVLDVTNRVAEKLSPQHEQIKKEVAAAPSVNADETGAKLNGKKSWLWLFMTLNAALFLLRPKRSSKVVEEVLGKNYDGIVGSDGLKQYPKIIKRIQRCWAHLLREAKFLAQKHGGQAKVLYNNLCEMFAQIKKITTETPMEIRKETHDDCVKKMQSFVGTAKAYKELKKFATTIENGMEHWFTCLLHPEIEPTNNRAERPLREFVVQRKIFGSFRSEKGMRTTEIILSLLSTWSIRGLNTYQMLRLNLSS